MALPQAAEVYDWIATAPADDEAFTAYFKDPHRLSVTLAVEHEGVVIGDLYLHIEDPWAQTEVKEAARGVQADIGWVLDPSYGGRGLVSCAGISLVKW